MLHWRVLLFALLVALFSAVPVLANTIIVNAVDNAYGWQNSLYIDESGTNEQLYFAGGIDISVDGYSRLAYCVDLFTNVNVPGTYATTMDYADTPNLKRVGWLMKNEWPSAPSYTGAALQLQGAAFQLAIWDIMVDGGNGFDAGQVQKSTDASHPTDPGVLAAAIQYETDSLGKSAVYGIVYHNVTTGSNPVTVQTLMGRNATDGGPSVTPEPGVVLLISSGLALIVLGRLRRRAAP